MVDRPFPLNTWYAVGWRHELRKGEVLGRTVCDAKIALWRTSAGAAVAVEAGTGALQGDRSQGVNGRVLNTITPATAKTCMYFWSLVRNYRLRDQTLTTQLQQANARIFEADRARGRPCNLNIDAGSLWARRLIDGLLAREREPHPAEQS